MLLNELFDSKRAVHRTILKEPDHYQSKAKVNDIDVNFAATYDEREGYWEVYFVTRGPNEGKFSLQVTGGGSELQILAVVHGMFMSFLSAYNNPDKIHFSALHHGEKKSRSEVYAKLLKRWNYDAYIVKRIKGDDGDDFLLTKNPDRFKKNANK